MTFLGHKYYRKIPNLNRLYTTNLYRKKKKCN